MGKTLVFQPTRTSNLSKAHETRDSLNSSCSHNVLVYLQPFRRNSHLKCALQPKITKKSPTPTNTPYIGGSRSFTVIEVDTPKKLVTSACYDKQHVYICNCFHARQANIDKITTCRGVPFFDVCVCRNP